MLERLNQLETNLNELEKVKEEYKIDDVKKDLRLQWIIRYGLFESIQIVIDVSCHLVTKLNLSSPKSYYDCIKKLNNEKILSNDLTEKLHRLIGLRNILVHEYVEIDIEKLFYYLENLDDFRKFVEEVKDIL
ncbi:MAG: DUF86 domain-containing protein [Melioribacteraceae bacterium]